MTVLEAVFYLLPISVLLLWIEFGYIIQEKLHQWTPWIEHSLQYPVRFCKNSDLVEVKIINYDNLAETKVFCNINYKGFGDLKQLKISSSLEDFKGG